MHCAGRGIAEEAASPVWRSSLMEVTIHLVGGGQITVLLDAQSLHDLAEHIRRERAIVGRLVPGCSDDQGCNEVLIPANRIKIAVRV